jgi:hypothetical protein
VTPVNGDEDPSGPAALRRILSMAKYQLLENQHGPRLDSEKYRKISRLPVN